NIIFRSKKSKSRPLSGDRSRPVAARRAVPTMGRGSDGLGPKRAGANALVPEGEASSIAYFEGEIAGQFLSTTPYRWKPRSPRSEVSTAVGPRRSYWLVSFSVGVLTSPALTSMVRPEDSGAV